MEYGMNKVLEGLYIGNLSDSKNDEQLTEKSITHVISIHNVSHHYKKRIRYLCLEVDDSPRQSIVPVFGECLEFIHRARADGGHVLVHCLAGISRSATIVAAYIVVRTKLNSEEAIRAIKAVRQYVNPNHGFRRQLEDWNRKDSKKWEECMEVWPEVTHDDQKRCSELLALYNSEVENRSILQSTAVKSDVLDSELEQTDSYNRDKSSRTSGGSSDSEGDCKQQHTPVIMGNAESVSGDSIDSGGKTTDNPSRLERIRNTLRKSFNKKQSKVSSDKKKKKSDDRENNNNGIDKQISNGSYYADYADGVTRSATLPNDINRIRHSNGELLPHYSMSTRDTSTLQARLLPAYQRQQPIGIIGNIQNRQRIMSSPSYTRARTNSQSSNYSQRYHGFRRVTTTHIPDHIDKRLVRSRSVGVIPDAELRMRRTTSASIVKLADCEDWIV